MLGIHFVVFLIFINFRYEVNETVQLVSILFHELPNVFSLNHTVITLKIAITLILCYFWAILGFEGYELFRQRSANDVPDILVGHRRKLISWVGKTNFIWSPLVFFYALFFAGDSPTFVYFQF